LIHPPDLVRGCGIGDSGGDKDEDINELFNSSIGLRFLAMLKLYADCLSLIELSSVTNRLDERRV